MIKKVDRLVLRRNIIRYIAFFSGLFIIANGVVFTINASLGVNPWDVFHIGVANQVGLTIGRVTQITGFVLVGISFLLKVRIFIGTVLNMIFLGFFVDLVISLNYIPHSELLWLRIVLYLTGVIIYGLGVAFYISPNLGAGPRDSMMLALTRVTRFSKGTIRTMMEVSIAIVGFLLGGPLGIGTVIFALTLGIFMELGFMLVGWIKKRTNFQNFWNA